MHPVWRGHVTSDGQVVLDCGRDYDRYALTLADKRIELVLRPERSQRSTQHNRYYWGVVVKMVSEELGYRPEEAHEALAHHLLPLGHDDARLPGRRSTSTLTVQEFADYVEACRQFAASELGLSIPEPNEVDYGDPEA